MFFDANYISRSIEKVQQTTNQLLNISIYIEPFGFSGVPVRRILKLSTMKITYFVVVLLLSGTLKAAETPQVIAPKTKIIQSVDWYADQSAKWFDVVLHQRSNVGAL